MQSTQSTLQTTNKSINNLTYEPSTGTTKEVSSISSEILLIVLSGSVLVIAFVFILFIALQIQKKHLKAKFNKQLNQIKNNNDDNDTNNTNMITLNSISSNTKSLTDNNSHKSKIKHSKHLI